MKIFPEKIIRQHDDPGLQPERTYLAWRRTASSLFIAASFFLRWFAQHGLFVATILIITILGALGIILSQNSRYRRACKSIRNEEMRAEVGATLTMSAVVAFIAVLGIYIVIFLPLR